MQSYTLIFSNLTKLDFAFLLHLAQKMDLQFKLPDDKLSVADFELDETEFLLQSKKNSKKLLQGVKDVELKRNLVAVNVKPL